MEFDQIVDLNSYPISDPKFRDTCRETYQETGVLVMPGFVTKPAITSIIDDGNTNRHNVFASEELHTVYLNPTDPAFAADHPRNRLVISSKGCLTDDQLPQICALRTLYNSPIFKNYLCHVLGESALYEYADPLSSINLHFAEKHQELGWHFDNSSFAITLMVQPPQHGGQFEYVSDVRDADAGEMNYPGVSEILDGHKKVEQLSVEAGSLVFFRGRNALHRVAPNQGELTRILAVLAYNAEPGVSLSEAARMTFYGRTG